MNRLFTFIGLIFLLGCQSQTQSSQALPEISENRTKTQKNPSKENSTLSEITEEANKASSEDSIAEVKNNETISKTQSPSSEKKKNFQKADLGAIPTQKDPTNLDFYKEFNDKDQLLIAASLATTVANEAISELLRFKESEIFLVCNKKESKFQLMTTDRLILRAWNLPKGVQFHHPQENRVLHYKKELVINSETQRKTLKRMWIEYDDFQIPNGDSMLSYAILLVTDEQRKCVIDIDKEEGQTSVLVLN